MAELQHSPTPWRLTFPTSNTRGVVRAKDDTVVVGADGVWDSAENWVGYGPEIENKADEALILHAPDLYHMLKEILSHTWDDSGKGHYMAEIPESALDLIEKIEKETE